MSYKLDQIFFSLSDSTRRDILRRLVLAELSVSEIAESYDMSLVAVSKHLKMLEQTGLVSRRRNGKKFYLKTDVDPLKEIESWMDFYRTYWQETFDHLDDYLAELQTEESNERSTKTK